MGVWPDAYYETFNMFDGNTFVGSDACAYNRTAMLSGQTATQVCFQQSSAVGGLLPADVDGATAPPAGSPNYMLTYGDKLLSTLQVSRRLQQSFQLHLHRTDGHRGCRFHAAVQWRIASACRSPAPTTSWTRWPIA